MVESSRTPSIAVAIGRSSRVFHLYITQAPAALDAPSTITLHSAPLGDLTGFADGSITPVDKAVCRRGRLILVDSLQVNWQRARCREAGARLIATDGLLFEPAALEHWLWQRLTTVASHDVEIQHPPAGKSNRTIGGRHVEA